MGSTAKILTGLALGVATGLFIGEQADPFRYVADTFVRLLEMTVLPYLTVSLIAGIGSLDSLTAKTLFLRVGALTVVLWAIALAAVLVMPLTFPAIEAATFFSTTLVQSRPSVDLLSLYVPANPFNSLANSVVPAVVLFSAVLGVALIGVERKQPLLEALSVLERALARANRLMIRLTPIGVLAIAAHVVGTVDLSQLARLRFYLESRSRCARSGLRRRGMSSSRRCRAPCRSPPPAPPCSPKCGSGAAYAWGTSRLKPPTASSTPGASSWASMSRWRPPSPTTSVSSWSWLPSLARVWPRPSRPDATIS
jgi:sodium:dicarboxylate symporter family protein